MILDIFTKKGPVARATGSFFILLIFVSAAVQAQTLRQQLANGKPMLCAHRGGMYDHYAENSLQTLDFLETSISPAPVMAEVDIRKSKDGTLYLLHDNTLERTTTGTGAIEDSSDEYLKTLKLRDSKGHFSDERIPTLSQLLDFVAKRNIFLMLDVKIDDWKQVLDLVKSKNATDKCLVLTFKPENSKKVHDLSPKILVSCLVKDRNDWNEISKIVPPSVMLAYINKTTPDDVIKEMKSKNILLVTDASETTTNNSNTYPVEFYRSLFTRGVNVLVTDLPNEVNALVK